MAWPFTVIDRGGMFLQHGQELSLEMVNVETMLLYSVRDEIEVISKVFFVLALSMGLKRRMSSV